MMMNHNESNPLLNQQQRQENSPMQGQYNVDYKQQQMSTGGGYGGEEGMPQQSGTPAGLPPQARYNSNNTNMMYPPQQGMMMQNSPQMMMQNPHMNMMMPGYSQPQSQLMQQQPPYNPMMQSPPMVAVPHQSYGGSAASISAPSFHPITMGGNNNPGGGNNNSNNFYYGNQPTYQPVPHPPTQQQRAVRPTMRPPYIDPNTQIMYDMDNPEYEGWLTKQSDWLKVRIYF
jgi:hypothetical protein